jgi:hypothetical protein
MVTVRQSVLSGAATNLLHAVDTIAAGLGLDETDGAGAA